jgi:hypothetical protein
MRQEIEYHQQDTAKGKLAGLILILLFFIVGAASSQNSVITEDFSDYKPGPQMTTTTNSSFSPSMTTSHQPAPQTSYAGQEVPKQNVMPQNEVKTELSRTGRTLLSLIIGILGTAILVKTTNATNGITSDYH